MRQTSEEFMNAMISDTTPSDSKSVNDMIAEVESRLTEKLGDMHKNLLDKLASNDNADEEHDDNNESTDDIKEDFENESKGE